MTDLLRRDMAPITDGAWQEIDRQSLRILKGHLSGRVWWTSLARTAGIAPR